MSQKKRRSPLNEKTKKALRAKAEGTRFTYGELAAVYRKGQGAYLSSGSRNVSMPAWSMARVNSYMRGGPARKVDKDIYNRTRKRQKRLLNVGKNLFLVLINQKGLRIIQLNPLQFWQKKVIK